MRQRPNINGIESIYTIPKSCDNCKNPFFDGDDIAVYPDKQISFCLSCWEDESLESNDWNWMHHRYSYKNDCNTFYNVSDIKKFENLIWEKVHYGSI